jgi:putative transposase
LQREHCQLHAYVLMTNHVHLLLTPVRATSVPRLIISVGRRYVQYVNNAYGRTGTLWDSRYKSSLVHAETYLLVCQRYIELNPVRAGMVSDPADYRWSSFGANALGQANAILSPHPLYLALASDDASRCAAYRDLFRTALDDAPLTDLRMALNQDQPIGNSRFYAQIEAMTGSAASYENGDAPESRTKTNHCPRRSSKNSHFELIEPGPGCFALHTIRQCIPGLLRQVNSDKAGRWVQIIFRRVIDYSQVSISGSALVIE